MNGEVDESRTWVSFAVEHGEGDGVGSEPFASNCVRLRCYSRLETRGMEAKNYAFDKRHRI